MYKRHQVQVKARLHIPLTDELQAAIMKAAATLGYHPDPEYFYMDLSFEPGFGATSNYGGYTGEVKVIWNKKHVYTFLL